MESKPKYINSLIPLRGIACLLVFLFHLFCLSGGYFGNESLIFFFNFGKYGVYMFFVISGFVITHSFILSNYKIENFYTFLKKRLIRIEPAYLFTLLLGILYIGSRNIFLENSAFFENIEIFQIFAHLGYIIPFVDYQWINIVFWTLAIEFQFYFLFAVLFPIISKYKFLLILICLPAFMLQEYTETIFNFLPVFGFGILLAFFYNEKLSFEFFLVYILIVSFLLISVNGWIIFLFTLPVFLIVFFSIGILSKSLDFLGKISYSLYLIHTLTAFAIINIAHKYPKTLFNQIGFSILAIFVTIVASYIMYKSIEEPTIKWSKNIKY